MHKQLLRPTSTKQNTESRSSLSSTVAIHGRKRNSKVIKPTIGERDSRTSISLNTTHESHQESDEVLVRELPDDFYVSIGCVGSRQMAEVAHLQPTSNTNNTLERTLRPISGLRTMRSHNNHIDDTHLNETDLVKRITHHSHSLKWLDFSRNNLSTFPSELCKLSHLTCLNLSHNKFECDHLPAELRNYEQLIELHLDSNLLTKIPKQLSFYTKLLLLNVRNNRLASLEGVRELRKLKYLIADENQVDTLRAEHLEHLEKLEILHVRSNRLVHIDARLFKLHLFALKQLDLSCNRLAHIPIELFMLPHMDILNLSCNELTRLPQMPITYRRASHMFQLDLSCNRLTKFYDYLLFLTRTLDLSSNRIRFLNGNSMRKLTNEQIRSRTIRFDENPLEKPPVDVCLSGWSHIREFFEQEEANSLVRYMHGFKILMCGPSKSGKTSLAYSIEDLNQQELDVDSLENDCSSEDTQQKVSKFIEIHELQLDIDEASDSNDEKHVKLKMPLCIYDLNGSLNDYDHLTHFFLDQNSLVFLCVDAENPLVDEVKAWLDYLLTRITKKSSFYIVTILTKCDLIGQPLKFDLIQILNDHVQLKLDTLKYELAMIEGLAHISPSQSDKLKTLANIYTSLKPTIYERCLHTSAKTMSGIREMLDVIREVATTGKLLDSKINTSIPSLWLEVEKYLSNVYTSSLSRSAPSSAMSFYGQTTIATSQNPLTSTHTLLYIDYNELKSKIINKFGMEHMYDEILHYLSSQGKILPCLPHVKIILKPNLFFDLIHVLFNVEQLTSQFKDVHTQLIRKRLCILPQVTHEVYINLVNELHETGHVSFNLFKLIWLPILVSDSCELLRELLLFFMYYYHLAYPCVIKHKLRALFASFYEITSTRTTSVTSMRRQSSASSTIHGMTSTGTHTESPNFESICVPFYLPRMSNDKLNFLRSELEQDTYLLPNLDQKCIISLKYSFTSTRLCGLFDRLSVDLLINTSVHFRAHFKNVIHAFNSELETMSCLIVHDNVSNEILFEFYLLNACLNLSHDTSDHLDVQFIDELWMFIMRLVCLFEEKLKHVQGIKYDRSSKCPHCKQFTFLGEWQTPKELQNLKTKKCVSCAKDVDSIFLVKPPSGKSMSKSETR